MMSAVMGGAAGSLTVQLLDDDCSDCGGQWGIALLGASVGVLTGATVGAGLPQFGSPCAQGNRLRHAAGGAIAGALLGGGTGVLLRSGGVGLWAAFGGASVGAATGATRCR